MTLPELESKLPEVLPSPNHGFPMEVTLLFVKEIVRLHGVHRTIVMDSDLRFTSHFWKSLQVVMDTKIGFSSAYHPQMNGQSERTIQTLKDMLRVCVLDFKGT